MARLAANLRALASPAETRAAGGLVEDNESGLESDVTEDGEADVRVGLDTSEAVGVVDGGVVDVLTGDGDLSITDTEDEVGGSGRAGEDVSTLRAVDLSTGDLLVVGSHDGVGEESKSGTGVGDTVEVGALEATAANAVASGGEAPEALAVVDIGVGDVTSVLGVVNDTEVISTSYF